jgi:hypothetical protein
MERTKDGKLIDRTEKKFDELERRIDEVDLIFGS